MTRDTKIGLLLGLVFIFIIAFLINGLPRLRGRSTNPAAAKGNRTQSTSPGLADREKLLASRTTPGSPFANPMPTSPMSGLQGQAGSLEPRSTMTLPTNLTPAGQTTPAAGTGQTPTMVASGNGPAPANMLLQGQPQTNNLAAGSAVSVTPANPVMTVSADTVIPARSLAPTTPQAGTPSQPTGVPGTLPPQSSTLPSPVPSASNPATTTIGPQSGTVQQSPAPAATRSGSGEWPKSYVVKSGDSLESIAKKMYGASEGVKPANIKRIFEANKGTLKSPERLSLEQKLTIPAPAGGTTVSVPVTPASQINPAPAPKPAVVKTSNTQQGQRTYTVKKGDSLWQIATAQLGKGTRYTEILKLNADTLKGNEDNLEQGMTLHLPAK
jgi:nucleoid-associated protein YgaU